MKITRRQLRRLIREALIEQVVGYTPPAKSEEESQNPDYVDDGDVSVSRKQGSPEDVQATGDAVQQLTQQRQKQLDTGKAVDAEETGRELGSTRRRRG